MQLRRLGDTGLQSRQLQPGPLVLMGSFFDGHPYHLFVLPPCILICLLAEIEISYQLQQRQQEFSLLGLLTDSVKQRIQYPGGIGVLVIFQ